MRIARLSLTRMMAMAASLLVASAIAAPARADFQLINNGGFEAGFAGWTRLDSTGSEGTFSLQSGTSSPASGDTVPAPPGGSFAAMSDGLGPGGHVLYQDFVVPTVVTPATLRFLLFVGNRATGATTPGAPLFASPATLDWTTPVLNQQARVDILRAGSDPFSVSASDVLLNAFQTNPGDPLVPGYRAISRDITSLLAANAGQTLRLRFAEVDNVFNFQLGVDNVSIASSVPEPSSLALCGIGTLLVLTHRLRRPRPPLP